MKKRVLILGSAGMAGHVITEYFGELGKYYVEGTARTETPHCTSLYLDVRNLETVKKTITAFSPSVVVNAIGVLVKAANENLENAIFVNSYLPHFLSRLASANGFKLVHISTDCVFSGARGQYSENDLCDGRTAYAKTKILGELNNNRDLTIRTSIIGPELKSDGTGLLDWFFKQSTQVSGYQNVFWSGVTTLELAKAIDCALDSDITGLVHLSAAKKISKLQLLQLVSKIWRHKIEILPDSTYQADKSLVTIRSDFSHIVPTYETMLIQLQDWMALRLGQYPHYAETLEG